MRIIVFFDLPVTTAAKRKAANQFRLFLQKDGYQMLQLSVYPHRARPRLVAKTPHTIAKQPAGRRLYTLPGSNRKTICHHAFAAG